MLTSTMLQTASIGRDLPTSTIPPTAASFTLVASVSSVSSDSGRAWAKVAASPWQGVGEVRLSGGQVGGEDFLSGGQVGGENVLSGGQGAWAKVTASPWRDVGMVGTAISGPVATLPMGK